MGSGPSGRTTQATQQRIKISWEELRLSQKVDGYGEATAPIQDLVRNALSARKEVLPAIVWIYDLEDEKSEKALESKVFGDMKTALALRRFVCLKGNLETIPSGKLIRDLRKRGPVFFFFDPAKNLFSRLEGKKAISKSRFYGVVQKLWGESFDLKIRSFTKAMGGVLDEIDEVEKKKQLLATKEARAAGTAGKLAKIRREKAKIEAMEKKVLKEEEELLASCKVRDRYLKGEPETARK